MNEATPHENRILLHGRLEQLPVFSHKNHDQKFYTCSLSVRRLSGAMDHMNVSLSQSQLDLLGELTPGEELTVRGDVRTFNNRSGVGSRLVISVFARTVEREPGEDENQLELSGTLCKEPNLRVTPLGRTICDMIVAVNRRYGRTDYLPCIAWGSLAHRCGGMTVGDHVSIGGRLQSRTYSKVLDDRTEERTAYEVSVMEIAPSVVGAIEQA